MRAGSSTNGSFGASSAAADGGMSTSGAGGGPGTAAADGSPSRELHSYALYWPLFEVGMPKAELFCGIERVMVSLVLISLTYAYIHICLYTY